MSIVSASTAATFLSQKARANNNLSAQANARLSVADCLLGPRQIPCEMGKILAASQPASPLQQRMLTEILLLLGHARGLVPLSPRRLVVVTSYPEIGQISVSAAE